MAFESLSEKLSNAFSALRSKGKLTEKDIDVAMREVRLAFLSADVALPVVKPFIEEVSQEAKGEKVFSSLTPAQTVIKIVASKLTDLLGGNEEGLDLTDNPSCIMMVGLQGSGKTTTSVKLANNIRKQGKHPLLVACDVYRPAAIDQLKTLAKQIDVPVFTIDNEKNVALIAKKAYEHAKDNNYNVVIFDTAGRLDIDETLMEELKRLKQAVKMNEILLVIDSMIGQESVNIAKNFNDKIEITGVIITKFDGDTRGGVALSVKQIVGKPIKYVGSGEKISDLEVFYPDRTAQRILGMGDVMTLIDKAQEAFDEDKAKEMSQKMLSNQFTLSDFLDQIEEMQKMGPISNLVGMIPGLNKGALKGVSLDDSKFAKTKAIIQSMTNKERNDPKILNGSRRMRIAKGSATKVQDVNGLLNQFENMKKMMKKMGKDKKFASNFFGG